NPCPRLRPCPPASALSPRAATCRRFALSLRRRPRACKVRRPPTQVTKKGAAVTPPPSWIVQNSVRGAGDRAAIAPDVDGDEQEQPHHVNEVPVPRCKLEAEMMLRREVAGIGA